MHATPNPAPGFRKHPDYRVEVAPKSGRVTVEVGNEIIADTEQALELLETNHDPVLYIPREDVRLDRLKPSPTRTTCPFKGTASHWSYPSDQPRIPDIAWSYESPYDEVRAIQGYVAFYPERVDRILVDTGA